MEGLVCTYIDLYLFLQVLALVPVYLLQICYGMNTGFPAILTPQLRENCSEFPIDQEQESWIVSIDNLATPFICILSGFLQQKFGPLRVCVHIKRRLKTREKQESQKIEMD